MARIPCLSGHIEARVLSFSFLLLDAKEKFLVGVDGYYHVSTSLCKLHEFISFALIIML